MLGGTIVIAVVVVALLAVAYYQNTGNKIFGRRTLHAIYRDTEVVRKHMPGEVTGAISIHYDEKKRITTVTVEPYGQVFEYWVGDYDSKDKAKRLNYGAWVEELHAIAEDLRSKERAEYKASVSKWKRAEQARWADLEDK